MISKLTLARIGSTAFLAIAMPAMALAQNPFTQAAGSITSVRTAAGITTGSNDVYQIAGRIINVVLGFLGIVLLGYLIYAGFLWMTSGGESDKAGEARVMITNAIIGLVIIVAAFAISNFVLSSLVNVTQTT